jgi:hypothetical protein
VILTGCCVKVAMQQGDDPAQVAPPDHIPPALVHAALVRVEHVWSGLQQAAAGGQDTFAHAVPRPLNVPPWLTHVTGLKLAHVPSVPQHAPLQATLAQFWPLFQTPPAAVHAALVRVAQVPSGLQQALAGGQDPHGAPMPRNVPPLVTHRPPAIDWQLPSTMQQVPTPGSGTPVTRNARFCPL